MPYLKLFGEASVDAGDGAGKGITSRRHPVALLCLLALWPSRRLARGKAVGLLWPESTEKAARNRLTTCLYQVRRAIGDEAIVSAGEELRLNLEVVSCDVHEFEAALAEARYERAVELCRGELLDGFHLKSSSEFEHWLERERDRLRRLYHEALEGLARGAEEQGQLERAATWWRRRMVAEPSDTRVARRLMAALAGAGSRGEALRVAKEHARILEEEFGAEPGEEFRALAKELETEPATPRREVSLQGGHPVGPAERSGRCVALIGREAERLRLEDIVSLAERGEPGVVLVGGEAGVGKSRLVKAAIESAGERGMWTLCGECVELGDSSLAYAPLIDSLRGLARQASPGALPELLGPASSALGTLWPGLIPASPGTPPSEEEIDGASQRGRMAKATAEALERLSRDRGVLLALEDIHWADEATLDILRYLTRALVAERVVVVATFRSDELSRRHPMVALLGELSRSPKVTRIDLQPFDRDDVEALLTGLWGRRPEPRRVDEIARRSGGNAFYVEQLAAVAAEENDSSALPPALRDVVVARLERLPESTYELFAPLAIAGQRVSYGLLAAIIGLEEDALAATLRPAIDRRLLLATDEGCEFQHALVREVVLGELLGLQRTRLHRLVATALESAPELSTGGRDQRHAELAYHWLRANETDRAFEACLAAAKDTQALGAFSTALSHYERALELWPKLRSERGESRRLEIVAEAAKLAELASAHSRAAAHLRELLASCQASDPENEAALRDRLVNVLFRAANHEQALHEAARAIEIVSNRPGSSAKAAAMSSYARLLRNPEVNRVADATRLCREALAIARAIGDRRSESFALRELGLCSIRSGALHEGIAQLREALATARELGDPHVIISAYYWLASAMLDADQVTGTSQSGELAEEVLEFLDGGGDRWPRSGSLHWLPARAFLRAGDWPRADMILERMARQHLEGHGLGGLYIARGVLYWMRGDLDRAEAEISSWRRALPTGRFSLYVLQLETEIAAERGRLADALACRDEVLSLADGRSIWRSRTAEALVPCVRAAVDAALAAPGVSGRDEALCEVEKTCARIRELCERLPADDLEQPKLATHVRAAEAELSRAKAPDPDLWRQVVADAPYHVWPAYSRVYAHGRLAEALLATGHGAADVLATAHAEARRLGAERLRGHLERLAQRARISLPVLDGAVTARELG